MLDFPLMLHVKMPVVDRIQPQSKKLAKGVENKATGDQKLNNNSPVTGSQISTLECGFVA